MYFLPKILLARCHDGDKDYNVPEKWDQLGFKKEGNAFVEPLVECSLKLSECSMLNSFYLPPPLCPLVQSLWPGPAGHSSCPGDTPCPSRAHTPSVPRWHSLRCVPFNTRKKKHIMHWQILNIKQGNRVSFMICLNESTDNESFPIDFCMDIWTQ